jgi:hypothetical protein
LDLLVGIPEGVVDQDPLAEGALVDEAEVIDLNDVKNEFEVSNL